MNSSLGKRFKNSITGIQCKNIQFKGRNKSRQKHGLVYIFMTVLTVYDNNQCCSSTVEDSSCPSAWHQYFITTSYKPSVILTFSVHSSYKDRPHDITPIGMFFFSWGKQKTNKKKPHSALQVQCIFFLQELLLGGRLGASPQCKTGRLLDLCCLSSSQQWLPP